METTATPSQYELERGKEMPSINHAFLQSNLLVSLRREYDALYSILPELSISLLGVPVVPDISIYPKFAPNWRKDEIRSMTPPLVAVEIISPTQGGKEFEEKLQTYFDAGVKSVWLVQALTESITVFLPDQKPAVFTTGAATDAATGITVKVEEIFT